MAIRVLQQDDGSVIIGALFMKEFHGVVPAMPVRPSDAGDVDHVPRDGPPMDTWTNAMG